MPFKSVNTVPPLPEQRRVHGKGAENGRLPRRAHAGLVLTDSLRPVESSGELVNVHQLLLGLGIGADS